MKLPSFQTYRTDETGPDQYVAVIDFDVPERLQTRSLYIGQFLENYEEKEKNYQFGICGARIRDLALKNDFPRNLKPSSNGAGFDLK